MRKLISLEGIVSLAFVFCLFTPLAVSIVQEDLEVSASEKRKLETFPEWPDSGDSLEEFPDKFERYYDDHFGFRSAIVRFHNFVLAKVFHVSPTSVVKIGSDNWYFLDADGAISDFIGRERYRESDLQRFKNVLIDRTEWLEDLGASYLFLPVPNKVNVYGDQLPLRIRRHSGETKYDQIVNFLLQAEDFEDVLDTQSILREGKKTQRVFLQTDSHWNHDGTYLVYLDIINRLQADLPSLIPLQLSKDKGWTEDFSGDLAIFMNLSGLITEKAPKMNAETTCETIPGRHMTELKEMPYYHDIPGHRLPAVTGCKEGTYKAVVIHDSFGRFLRPYLSQHFKEIIFVNYMNFEQAKVLIEKVQPDVVIDQRAARNLQRALRPDHELENLMLAARFEQLPTRLAEIKPSRLEDTITEKRSVDITSADGGLQAYFNANKSTLSLRFTLEDEVGSRGAAVRLPYSSEHNMQARLCYWPTDEPAAQQCIEREFKKGDNELYYRIITPEPDGILSIVASEAGELSLKGVSARSE